MGEGAERKPREMKPSAMPARVERSARAAWPCGPARRQTRRKFDAGDQGRQQGGLPRDARRIGRTGPLASALAGSMIEEDVREQGNGVDAVGQRADVVAARAFGEPPRLDGVGDVPDQDGNRRRGRTRP